MTTVYFSKRLSDFQKKTKPKRKPASYRYHGRAHLAMWPLSHRVNTEVATTWHKEWQTAVFPSVSFCWAKIWWFSQNTFEPDASFTNALGIKPYSDARRSHKELFLGTLVDHIKYEVPTGKSQHKCQTRLWHLWFLVYLCKESASLGKKTKQITHFNSRTRLGALVAEICGYCKVCFLYLTPSHALS